MINKLGLVLECAREGADEKVLTCLLRRLSPQTKLAPAACKGSKKELINSGADAAKLLLEADGCNRVFFVWDLKPEWIEEKQLLTCAEECALIAAKLDALGIRERVDLICIVEMLETWIVADDRAVREYISRPNHQSDFRRVNAPEAQADPKSLLQTAFESTSRKTYRDHTDAVRIIQKCPDTSRLLRVSSFSRFVMKLTGQATSPFCACGDVCNDLARSGLFQPVRAPQVATTPSVVAVPRKGRPRRR